MPHYPDGTEAKIGDLVFGTSNSGKDPVAGYVVSISPGATTCNMHVATIRPLAAGTYFYGVLMNYGPSGEDRQNFYPSVEIANCSDFSLLHRPGGMPNDL